MFLLCLQISSKSDKLSIALSVLHGNDYQALDHECPQPFSYSFSLLCHKHASQMIHQRVLDTLLHLGLSCPHPFAERKIHLRNNVQK